MIDSSLKTTHCESSRADILLVFVVYGSRVHAWEPVLICQHDVSHGFSMLDTCCYYITLHGVSLRQVGIYTGDIW